MPTRHSQLKTVCALGLMLSVGACNSSSDVAPEPSGDAPPGPSQDAGVGAPWKDAGVAWEGAGLQAAGKIL